MWQVLVNSTTKEPTWRRQDTRDFIQSFTNILITFQQLWEFELGNNSKKELNNDAEFCADDLWWVDCLGFMVVIYCHTNLLCPWGSQNSIVKCVCAQFDKVFDLWHTFLPYHIMLP